MKNPKSNQKAAQQPLTIATSDGSSMDAVPVVPKSGPALINLDMIREEYVPLSERTLYRMISVGSFPGADFRSGTKVRLWKRSRVEEWIDLQSKMKDQR